MDGPGGGGGVWRRKIRWNADFVQLMAVEINWELGMTGCPATVWKIREKKIQAVSWYHASSWANPNRIFSVIETGIPRLNFVLWSLEHRRRRRRDNRSIIARFAFTQSQFLLFENVVWRRENDMQIARNTKLAKWLSTIFSLFGLKR